MVPAVLFHLGAFVVLQPVRPMSYSGALNAMRHAFRVCGVAGDVGKWSLHSPRFFMASLAGQLRFPTEERRTLGRWGPASGMPVRYDRSRCVTELLLKYDIVERLRAGFKPAGAFELPGWQASRAAVTPGAAPVSGLAAAAVPEQERESVVSTKQVDLVLNSSSKVLHRQSPEEPRRTMCAFWWATSRRSVEAVSGLPQHYVDEGYVRCGKCWCRARNGLPEWQGEESSSADGGPPPQDTRDSDASDGSASTDTSDDAR